jgi:hypothetical protein
MNLENKISLTSDFSLATLEKKKKDKNICENVSSKLGRGF